MIVYLGYVGSREHSMYIWFIVISSYETNRINWNGDKDVDFAAAVLIDTSNVNEDIALFILRLQYCRPI